MFGFAAPKQKSAASSTAPAPIASGPLDFDAARSFIDLAGVEEEATSLLDGLRPLVTVPSAMERVLGLRAHAAGVGSVLVGGSGSGKTALASAIAIECGGSASSGSSGSDSGSGAARTVWLDCRALRGSSSVAVRRVHVHSANVGALVRQSVAVGFLYCDRTCRLTVHHAQVGLSQRATHFFDFDRGVTS